jgi:ferredoxin
MIVASPKSVTELKQLVDRHKKVLFVGCGTCVTVCLAGGEREVGIAGYATRMARKLACAPQIFGIKSNRPQFSPGFIG